MAGHPRCSQVHKQALQHIQKDMTPPKKHEQGDVMADIGSCWAGPSYDPELAEWERKNNAKKLMMRETSIFQPQATEDAQELCKARQQVQRLLALRLQTANDTAAARAKDRQEHADQVDKLTKEATAVRGGPARGGAQELRVSPGSDDQPEPGGQAAADRPHQAAPVVHRLYRRVREGHQPPGGALARCHGAHHSREGEARGPGCGL
eukprot:TRINITY_DN26358_c0_g1_i1.p1 TRINITY_DN26358_c0_g1~~TRINITY_DN26358_c0_g1_i1.p1  ORF type:complete len:229 (+),score=31.61 TRINITY_DN26358_c0_g1_i1:69-689(+)